jgi:outer membrane protein assembly factor BamB
MTITRPWLLCTLALTAGCYGIRISDGRDGPPETSDPVDHVVAVGDVALANGELLLDAQEPVDFIELPGTPTSISDDGRFVVTCRWSSDERVAHLAAITDLSTLAETTMSIRSTLFSCPVISGDGTTLVYSTALNRDATLYALDRASLASRPVWHGELGGHVAISDDGRVMGFVACTGPSADCQPRAHLLDVIDGGLEILDGPVDPRMLAMGLSMAGRAARVVHPISSGPDLWEAVALAETGELERPVDLTGVPLWTGISDDGRVIVSSRTTGTRSWQPEAPVPVLDLAVATEDGTFHAVGPAGTPTVPVYGVALSGDGSTAVFSVAAAAGPRVVRLRLADGRTELVTTCSGFGAPIVSDDGRVIGVGIYNCPEDPSFEPNERTRIFRLD